MLNKNIIPILCFILIGWNASAQLESHEGDNGKMGFMDNGTWVISPIYEKVSEFYDFSIAGVKLKGKWGFIDRTGKTVLPFQYTEINYNEGALSTVSSNGKFGMIDLVKGVEVMKCQYDKLFYFDNSLFRSLGMVALVQRSGKEGIVKLNGTEVIPCLYDPSSIQEEDSTHFIVKLKKREGMIDLTGKQVVPCQFDQVMMNPDNFIDTAIGNKKGLYSLEGKEIAPCIYDRNIMFESDGYAMVMQKGKFGLIDKTGVLVLPCKYSSDVSLQAERDKLGKK